MTPRHLLVPVAVVCLTACLTACADDAPDRGAQQATTVAGAIPVAGDVDREDPIVRIERSRFSNAELTIAPGTTVVFVNDDAFAHTVTSRDGAPTAFDSGELGQSDTFEVTFEEPGTYPYFCQVHPTMRALVVVA